MIQTDSRKVKKGDVFVAIKGLNYDGHDFIEEAKKRGAVEIFEGKDKLGELAKKYYGDPSSKIKVIGVTGTKGKTTVCHLIHHILTSLGHKTGLISTITTSGFHTTTPDVVTLNKKLADMVKKGYEHAVVEVSSHGIDQGRVAGIKFEVGVLTNIAPEHLDYHKTFAAYKKTKLDFIRSCKLQVTSNKKTNLNILPGEFNNLNAELALKVIYELGFKNYEKNLATLKTFKLPEGRLEEIDTNKNFRVFIDFAHTPESLEEVLKHLRTLTKGCLISVFGCAGERDILKRPKMGKISTDLADLSIFTAEDPRSEDIFDILKQMESKADPKKFVSIPQRGEAIVYALSKARKGDVVAILGKGHEKSMAYGKYEHPWNDKEFVTNCLFSDKKIKAIILAAGMGTRMKSSLPKVLHKICGRPMVAYTLENLRKSGILEITVVVSYKKDLVLNQIKGAVSVAIQDNSKGGTADAVRSGLQKINSNSSEILVINGDDSAFYTPNTIKRIIQIHRERGRILTFVSLIKNNPIGLGRVIRGKNGLITKIVEEKEASDTEKKIKEVNDGLYLFNEKWLRENINKVKKSTQGEYYLVDLIKLAIDQEKRMATYTLPDNSEWHGINTQVELSQAETKMIKRLERSHDQEI